MRAMAKLGGALRTYPELLRDAGYYRTNNSKTDYFSREPAPGGLASGRRRAKRDKNCDVDPAVIWSESGASAHWRNRPSGAPFMAVFNLGTTHESFLFEPVAGAVAPAEVRVPAYLPDTPEIRQDFATYYNLIERMDAEVGARLKELDDAGIADDTVVFYYSDNGGALPRTKRYCYDQGLHCALVVSVPPRWAHLAPASMGSVVETPTSLVDLAPTLLSIAGVDAPPEMQGSAFLGRRVGPPRRYVFGMRNRMDERYDFVRAASDGRFHYLRNYTPHRVFQHGAFEWLAKGYQSWEREYLAGRLDAVQLRFFAGRRPFEELYDLYRDPDQVRNLAADPAMARQLDAMRGELDRHLLAINDNGFIPEGMEIEGWRESRDRAAYPLERVMELAAAAAARDPANLASLIGQLDDPNAVIRHWAILGILMLGEAGLQARDRLAASMRDDPLVQNRVAAAEAVARLAPSPEAVTILADLLDQAPLLPVRLQAINALTFLGEQARTALAAIERAAAGEQELLRSAGRYLSAVLTGRYDPTFPVVDLDWLRTKHAGG
jgi:arylsulfatase A-like enzyme